MLLNNIYSLLDQILATAGSSIIPSKPFVVGTCGVFMAFNGEACHQPPSSGPVVCLATVTVRSQRPDTEADVAGWMRWGREGGRGTVARQHDREASPIAKYNGAQKAVLSLT